MTKKDRYKFAINFFKTQLPGAETELVYDGVYQLLVAVILSAQCTDKRVNLTTPALFEKYSDILSLSQAKQWELLELIKSISYPNNKTKHLIAMAKMVIYEYNGKIPMTVGELILLPGVGRKTAHVITSVIDNQPNMAVDTHVFRVSARLGLTSNAKTPLAAEKQLMQFLPTELVHKAHHWLILHGRYICVAKDPKCDICGLRNVCKFYAAIRRNYNIIN